MRKRGRPKGAGKTVIGLPRKKSRGSRLCHSYTKVLSKRNLVCLLNSLCGSWKMFSFLVILTWFVDLQIAKDAIDGSRIIEEDDVEMRPEMVSSSCTDEYVCLDMCRKYCTREAWAAINSVVSVIQANPTWYCGRCTAYSRYYVCIAWNFCMVDTLQNCDVKIWSQICFLMWRIC